MREPKNTYIDIAKKLCARYNPYIEHRDEYPEYRKYTDEELNQEYIKTAIHDIHMGYADRIVGYYDKWYRYNRMDDGNAYDEGVRVALSNPDCKPDMRIIPA